MPIIGEKEHSEASSDTELIILKLNVLLREVQSIKKKLDEIKKYIIVIG